jgi:hypothetical protein
MGEGPIGTAHVREEAVTEPGVGKADGRSRRLRCLGRFAFTVPMAAAGLLLALTDVSGWIAMVLVTAVWLGMAASMIEGIVRAAKAANKAATSGSSGRINPFYFMGRAPRACAWSSLLLLAIAAGALFAAGRPALAATAEIFLFMGLAFSLAPDSEFMPERKDPFERDYTPIASAPGVFGAAVVASAVWLALGQPPAWAGSMILTWFWIVAVGSVVFQVIAMFGMSAAPWFAKHRNASRRQSAASEGAPAPTPEPIRTLTQQFNMWLWRASWIAVSWALWSAGQPLLAGLYLTGKTLVLTSRVHFRRLRHGDTAQIDPLARVVHFLLWRPLTITATVVGILASVIIVIPLSVLGAIWGRIVGAPPPQLAPETEREARVRQARIRRAAASYRLREEFCKPDGFVYFICSEPHQREHFLGPGGLLAGPGNRVVARDYRQHFLETRTSYNWMAFEQAPEGALLHVNGIGNMQKDLPFIAIVPPKGRLRVFKISPAYRARRRDKGAALAGAEAEIRAAIETAFGEAG